MNSYEWIMIVFTGVIALSTAIYTYYSHKLWKATRTSTDIARYNTFMSYLMSLSAEASKVRETDPEAAQFYDQLATLMMDIGISRFIEEIELKKNPEIRDYFNKVEGMFRAKGIDPSQISWFKPIMDEMKK